MPEKVSCWRAYSPVEHYGGLNVRHARQDRDKILKLSPLSDEGKANLLAWFVFQWIRQMHQTTTLSSKIPWTLPPSVKS